MITGKWYDRLKFLAQIVLPALGTFYFTLAQIWGLPAAEEVVGTILAVDTFLGVILGLSQAKYLNNEVATGILQVQGGTHRLDLDDDVEVLPDVTEVRLAVNAPQRKSKKGKGKKPLASVSRHRTGGASSWINQSRPN